VHKQPGDSFNLVSTVARRLEHKIKKREHKTVDSTLKLAIVEISIYHQSRDTVTVAEARRKSTLGS